MSCLFPFPKTIIQVLKSTFKTSSDAIAVEFPWYIQPQNQAQTDSICDCHHDKWV
ncbi:hypothetical protein [Calothrix sp. NIES-3974]|uniref:hypothetical protein n=1 Tax=Calothrix sp. NIES-3974 TaxID=2005462 RepID=UPI0012FDB256|nr:hypothetical protein [Calothrix sp. NIES-3974]